MIICGVNKAGKMYGGNIVFETLAFEINEKERIGLVGRNGGGKTTLLRLLAGVEAPDGGQIHWQKGLKIGYLAQIPEYPHEMTARHVLNTAFDEILKKQAEMETLEHSMGIETKPDKLEKLISSYGRIQDAFTAGGGYEIDANIERVANGLGISGLLDKKFQDLSGGEKTKVGLALSLLKNPDLLLLDEPTNHLDLMAVEWLAEFLKNYAGSVVIISHDRYFLDEVALKILDLEDGDIRIYHSNYSGFMREKEERLLREFAAYEEQQKKIKKMKEAIKRLKEWANRSNPPSEGLHKRARNMERALERMEKFDRPLLNRKKMGLGLEAGDRSGNDVVILKGAAVSFPGRQLFSSVNMHLRYRERAAIVGENGSGKTTLLKLIMQELAPDFGEVKIGSNVKIGYLSQHIENANGNETVIDLFRSEVTMTEGEARNILARFLFYGPAVFRRASQLSGGEKMRLRLAQLMYQDINLLILDEPTNHLDIDSREVLEEALSEFDGTLLAVSHDRYFLNQLFTKIYWLEDKEVHCFEENYDGARARMIERRKSREPGPAVVKKRTNEKAVKKDPSVMVTQLEQQIEKLEAQMRELDRKMAEESNVEILQQLYFDKEQLSREYEELFDRLEEIS
ncbi:ribosomal protection-like ABC-F family protein [Bacillus sp. T33-2]|uniref:ribosomal protection-like ABC-F family protein n=1 Tax=Bacillus sp. T33-2 TaxID=2054168 RepID=UPI000C78CFA0|nr:ABC-F type ribosomal protection protein [Bacillus sp. T33-2]PLR96080.1 ABC transporter ATP-binding protein [Bacillus sp. T33-2]